MKYQPSYTKLLVRTSYKQHNPKHLKLIKLFLKKMKLTQLTQHFIQYSSHMYKRCEKLQHNPFFI